MRRRAAVKDLRLIGAFIRGQHPYMVEKQSIPTKPAKKFLQKFNNFPL